MKWTDEKITEELKNVCEHLERFPTAQELRSIKKSSLLSAIIRDKGLSYYRQAFGFELNKNPQNYWLENFEIELKQLIQQLGRFPEYDDFNKYEKTGILKAIHRRKETLNDYRIKYNYEIIKKTKNYWMDWNNLSKELQPLIKNNVFPSGRLIINSLGAGAIKSIRYFGGIKEVSKKMGYEPSFFYKTTDGHYVHSSNEYIFDEYLYSRNIPHETNNTISNEYNYKYDFKINNIYFEIWGLHTEKYNKKRKVKEAIYKKLNLRLISIESYDFEKSIADIEKHFDNLFQSLNIDISQTSKEHLRNATNTFEIWNEEKTTTAIKELINKLGHFPKKKELIKLRYPVDRYGGLNHFANKLGYECKPYKYWSDNKIIEQLKPIINQTGHFPTTKELGNIDRKLLSAICEFGGITKFKHALLLEHHEQT